MGVCTKERKSVTAEVLMATLCTWGNVDDDDDDVYYYIRWRLKLELRVESREREKGGFY